eukprot:2056494-Amphidinium_carterae.1
MSLLPHHEQEWEWTMVCLGLAVAVLPIVLKVNCAHTGGTPVSVLVRACAANLRGCASADRETAE